ncbi:MAG: aspartate kinase [Myxococcales bacterium]|nr:aspartate kinase [Myxococcales bacterium]MCB9643325.1 aspartate kinase [Myxococcales bacterium]
MSRHQGKVVMKFGGTSVGTPEAILRTAQLIARETRWPIVVVSALSGVTDMLLELAEQARRGDDFGPLKERVMSRHDVIIEKLELEKGLIDAQYEELQRMLSGVQMLREVSPRVRDIMLSLGERMSVRLMAATLRKIGCPAKAWDSWELGMRTDQRFARAGVLPECYPEIESAVARIQSDEIAVVTGFIARSIQGEITTLGRGGSDFSAAVFGAAAKVDEIQIWTDVPGILRADPRIVGSTSIAPEVSFEEAAELAFFGAKVLHPRTIEPARRNGIPVRVLGTFHVDPFDPDPRYLQGTLIDDNAPVEPLRAIALRKNVRSLLVRSLGMLEAPGFLSRVFEVLSRHQVSVDAITTSEVSVSMTFDYWEGDLDAAIAEISSFAYVEQKKERSLLCLVGAGLRQDSSLLAKIFTILGERQIPLHMVSQGASRINITLVTEPNYASEAMRALHEAFFISDAVYADRQMTSADALPAIS